ncbi:hypothetical protein BpHYR1_012375 [Brachionus plicatilis]|uniref:RING-type domain-containing protein n=1 Tax=Brachionus plicatilis TaxID=10195 RepID=A0A3M7RU98_BRAPC|nr:hypothetical protein BpHYR1_012375 [Brachionus plicatilis]
MKIEAEGDWDYLKCVFTQFQVKLTSQLVREKDLNMRKRAVRIREAQLEYNEKRFSERLADNVNTRVKAKLSNRPEPPTVGPVFVSLRQSYCWDRYLDEKIKTKFEILALAAAIRKSRFRLKDSAVLELMAIECGLCARPLVYLSKKELMRTASGHLFCADCIFRSTVEILECPTCEAPIEYSKSYFPLS